MSQHYASSQSMGYKNHIEKVAIVGAGGNVGKHITNALLQTGKHTVTAITRADSKSTLPSGVSAVNVDYADQSSLVKALEGHDALVITMSVFGQPDSEIKLIDAASTAGVSWVMLNSYSTDIEHNFLAIKITVPNSIKSSMTIPTMHYTIDFFHPDSTVKKARL